jgi:hypothetical protein
MEGGDGWVTVEDRREVESGEIVAGGATVTGMGVGCTSEVEDVDGGGMA